LDWHAISWRKVFRSVRRLQIRIAEAMRRGRRGKVHALRRILTRSLSAAYWAVRRVTENQGKKTPGVDGIIWSTPEAKQEAARFIQTRRHTPLPLRRVYIPKANGKRRPLGIPAMQDRATQALHGLALEPIAEHLADPNSYGFRRERSTADAIGQCYITLAKRASPEWALEGDITACFDQISHAWLLQHMPMDKCMLAKWLKSGYIERKTFHVTEEGTPQGATISPVLCNMTLDGLERELKARFKRRKVNLIRYADDFIVTGDSEALLREEVTPVIKTFLAERGLTLSGEKTRIVHIAEGFDFLGQNIRKYHGKLLIQPAKKGVKKLLDNLRGILKRHPTAKPATVIRQMNPVLRGWVNYHRHVCSKKTFADIDVQLGQAVWHWAKRRHPNTPKTWIKARYWPSRGGKNGVFTGKEEHGQTIHLLKAVATPIQRHVKVQGKANPYDPAFEGYFEQRLGKKWAAGYYGNAKITRLWQRQEGKCPPCGHPITPESRWHVHHKIPRVEGGPNTLDNLRLLHPDCHRQLHARHSMTGLAPARGL
jgi:RNA-directed DNA polymerase